MSRRRRPARPLVAFFLGTGAIETYCTTQKAQFEAF
jgi:hypothetical protein